MAGISSGGGWAVGVAYQLDERMFPFLRFGSSCGGAAEDAVSVGLEITRHPDEVLTRGFGWVRPSEKTCGPGLRNEYVVKTSYKIQMTQYFSLTPDIQALFRPANDPSRQSVWVFGLRAILFNVRALGTLVCPQAATSIKSPQRAPNIHSKRWNY